MIVSLQQFPGGRPPIMIKSNAGIDSRDVTALVTLSSPVPLYILISLTRLITSPTLIISSLTSVLLLVLAKKHPIIISYHALERPVTSAGFGF
jgi:hypothetical protein